MCATPGCTRTKPRTRRRPRQTPGTAYPSPSQTHTYTHCGWSLFCSDEWLNEQPGVCVWLKGRVMGVIQVIKVNAYQLSCLPFVHHPACLCKRSFPGLGWGLLGAEAQPLMLHVFQQRRKRFTLSVCLPAHPPACMSK